MTLYGEFPTQLLPMENQTAGVVLATMRQQTAVPLRAEVEEIFPERHRIDTTDLHGSNMAALREEALSRRAWAHAHARCGLHRIRTAELSALKLDAATDSFCLNVTISLRAPGVMSEFRRQARAWVQSRLRVLPGEPPVEVHEWRQAVMGRFVERVENGGATNMEAVRSHVWQTFFTGGGRRRDRVEHYHNASCAGIDDVCKARCLEGLDDLLQQTPATFSRRSWHGHHTSVDHIICLEAIHGLLSECYGSVVQRAEARAANCRRAVRAKRGGGAPAPAAGAGGGAPAPAAGAEGADSLLLGVAGDQPQDGKYAEEEAARARSVQAYLQDPGHLDMLMQYSSMMGVFASVRAPVLRRAAPAWDAKQASDIAQRGRRAYRLCEAYLAREVERGLVDATELLFTEMSSGRCSTARPAEFCRAGHLFMFSIVSRAGGSLVTLALKEQRRYPGKLYRLVSEADDVERRTLAQEIMSDSKAGRGHALDPVSRDHVRRHGTVEELCGAESLAKLESQALFAPDTTSSVERGHSEVKRAQISKEQTHRERLRDASAARVLQRARAQSDTFWVARSRRSGAPAPVAKQAPKRRRVCAWHAWMSENAGGSMATRAKRHQCKRALANPATRREYAAMAKAMGDQPRRFRQPFDRRLRLARERAQRARQPWDIGLARQQLLEEDRLGFQLAKRRRLARLKRQRHGDRELESQMFQFLGQVVADTARHLPTWLERVDGNPFVPTPESQHATTACWNPDWRPWLLEELPTLMAQQGLAAEVAWDLQHQVVTKEHAARVRAGSAAAKRARVCYESGLCLCRVSDGFRAALLGAFARAMAKALVKADSMGGGITARGPQQTAGN